VISVQRVEARGSTAQIRFRFSEWLLTASRWCNDRVIALKSDQTDLNQDQNFDPHRYNRTCVDFIIYLKQLFNARRVQLHGFRILCRTNSCPIRTFVFYEYRKKRIYSNITDGVTTTRACKWIFATRRQYARHFITRRHNSASEFG
jgi:hypothetical protein